MNTMLIEKANALGISDAEYMSEDKLKREVEYASLDKEGRRDMAGRQARSEFVTRTHLPDPMVVRRVTACLSS